MSSPNNPSALIIAFVADLMFSARIENTALQLGFQVKFIEHTSHIADTADHQANTQPRLPGEALHGLEGALIDKITRWQPALLLFDFNNSDIPWLSWLKLLKSSPATRRIPTLVFGPHMDTQSFSQAQDAGADVVIGRSRLVSALPDLLQKYARIPDYTAVRNACEDPLSELALKGLGLFNQKHFFEAHEYLEDAWNNDNSAAKELYRALIQIAVAYLQIERKNYRGAVKMFLRVRQWLEPLPDFCRGVNIKQLRADAAAVEHELQTLGPENLNNFNSALFKPIIF